MEARKDGIRRWCDAINSDEWAARVAEFHDPAEQERFVEEHTPFRRAFAGYHFAIDGLIGEGDTVVTWGTVTARHVAEFPFGELKGVPATGKPVSWKEVWIERFEGDRLVDFQLILDGVSRLQQLGALPPA
ncbi:ester cyclase [Promineifilum sp.]|uniref:ester cyclase n=1 Tax=Promineifilum sp. TaxID=2664178 RepID=UPI0035B3EEE5